MKSPVNARLLLVALLASSASAQTIFSMPKIDRFGADNYLAADFNGDGIRDFVYPHFETGFRLATGRADGALNAQGELQLSGLVRRARSADVDGDGDVDLVYTDRTHFRIGLNDGEGVFTLADGSIALPHPYTSIETFELADLDNDGDLDVLMQFLVQTNNTYQTWIAVFSNLGDGTFEVTRDQPGVWMTRFALAKVNADDFVDLVYVDGALKVAYNDGTGVFGAPVTLWANPGVVYTWRLDVADADRDGDNDIVILIDEKTVTAFLNDGSGSFVTTTVSTGDYAAQVHFVDLAPGPARLAIVVVEYDSTLTYYPGTSQGWASPTSMRAPKNGQRSMKVPADSLGRERLVVSGWDGAIEYWPDGAGGFRNERVALSSIHSVNNTAQTHVADVDGDGDDDILIAAGTYGFDYFINDGVGNFTKAVAQPMPKINKYTPAIANMATGDFDGVGPDEAIFYDGAAFILFNTNASALPFDGILEVNEPYISLEMTTADINRDGKAEFCSIALTTDGGWRLLIRNYVSLTAETISAVPIPQDNTLGQPTELVSGDFDGDGDGDFAWRYTNTNLFGLARNDGGGAFTVSVRAFPAMAFEPAVRTIAVGDIDQDGRADLFWGEHNGFGWLKGDPTLSFATGQQYDLGYISPVSARIFDFDGDDDIDVAIVDDSGPGVRVLLNDGTGQLTTGEIVMAVSWPAKIDDGDFDGDKRRDVVVISADTPAVEVMFGDRQRPAYNFAPKALPGTATVSVNALSVYNGMLLGNDPDGDALNYQIVSVSSGSAQITNASTGAFQWTPNSASPVGADVVFTVSDQRHTSAPQTFKISVTTTPVDLKLKFKGPKGKLYVNQNLTYTFSVKALTKGVPTSGVKINLPLPAGATFVSGSIPGGSCSVQSGAVRCASTTALAAKATMSGVITVAMANAGTLALTATASSAVPDPVSTNNTITVSKSILSTAQSE